MTLLAGKGYIMEEGKKTGYDIGTILREMREEYWQGLAETEEAEDESLECVTFALGGEIYAFETVCAAEIDLAGDKWACYGLWQTAGVATPATCRVRPLTEL